MDYTSNDWLRRDEARLAELQRLGTKAAWVLRGRVWDNVAVSLQPLVSPTSEELNQMPFHRFAAFNIAQTDDCQSNSFKNLHEVWVSLPK